MASNELENLMSQLHVDSQVNMDVHTLGIQTTKGRTVWSYKEEKTHTRDGHLRHRPLSDDFLNRQYDPPIYYIPKFGEFLVDDMNNRLKTFQVPQTNIGSIKFESLTKEQVISLYFNEHWQKQRIKNTLNGRRRRRGGGGGGGGAGGPRGGGGGGGGGGPRGAFAPGRT